MSLKAGWIIAAIAVVLGADPGIRSDAQPKPQPKPTSVKILVTKQGFEPSAVTVPRDKPVTLVFERKVRRTCVKEVIFRADGKRYEKALPLDTPVTVRVTFKTAGIVTYHSAMNVFGGTITVR